MTARLFAFVIWAALAASVVTWALKLGAGSRPVPAHAVVVGDSAAANADLSRLLGAEAPVASAAAPASPTSSRLKLLGVVAARSEVATQSGLALIAVDGKPARPYRVGGQVEQDLILLEVRQRSASLGPARGPASVKLEMPPLVAAATGSRPTAMNGGMAGPAAVPLRAPNVFQQNLLPPPPPPAMMQQPPGDEGNSMPVPEAMGEPEGAMADGSAQPPDPPPRIPAFGRRAAPTN